MANIALYPGGYKPPHIGHYEAAKEALTQADKVIVFVGPKEREDITQDMSIALWELYTQKDNIEIKKAGVSPVRDVYDFVELEAEDGDTISFIKGEKDSEDPRFARIPTYAEKFNKKINIDFIDVEDKTDRMGYPVSGTWMRNYIKKNKFQDFKLGLPKHLTAEEENEAWAIVTGNTDYSSPKGGTQSSQFEESVFSKKWWEDNLDLEEPYGDTTSYRDHWKSNVPGPKKDIPRTKNQIHNRQTAPVSWEERLIRDKTIHQLYEMGGTMTNQEKAKHYKNLKRLNKDLKKINNGNQYVEVPSYLKGTLTRKLYEQEIPSNNTSTALINNIPIPLETMNTPEEHMTGMMGRDSLEGGMLFPYDTVQRRDFHMQNCKIPLDIIFIKQGKINNIHHNCPPCKQNNCPKYSGIADNVLEFPGGYCKKHNINRGDEINLNINQQDNKVKYTLKEKALTKGWWGKIINEILLTEGGAAGHMAHPFNLPNVNSGKELLDIFEKSADSLDKNPGSVKIDGVNSSIRLIDLDGEKQFVMDRGSKKPLDIKGITKDDLVNRFGDGHGMVKVGGEVLDIFNEALPSLENDLKKLGVWDDPNILFNMEYVSGKTNVQDYGSNFIAIHGLNRIESKEVQGKRQMLTKRVSSEISYSKKALDDLLDNLKPIAKKQGFEVYGSVPTKMSKKPNFNSALSQNYSVEFTEEVKTQPLSKWLDEISAIPKDEFIFITRDNTSKKVGAVSKQVYQLILNKENVDDLFDENDKKKAIDGFVTYLATEKLGDEVLKVLDSPMGSVENHEGVVIRDENIASVPFKITGKFILGGLTSDF